VEVEEEGEGITGFDPERLEPLRTHTHTHTYTHTNARKHTNALE